MLVFTRKPMEGFWIEIDGVEPIHVVFPSIGFNRAKVSISADKDQVRIYRDEVYTRVLQERLKEQTPVTEIGTCPALPPLPSVPNSKTA